MKETKIEIHLDTLCGGFDLEKAYEMASYTAHGNKGIMCQQGELYLPAALSIASHNKIIKHLTGLIEEDMWHSVKTYTFRPGAPFFTAKEFAKLGNGESRIVWQVHADWLIRINKEARLACEAKPSPKVGVYYDVSLNLATIQELDSMVADHEEEQQRMEDEWWREKTRQL